MCASVADEFSLCPPKGPSYHSAALNNVGAHDWSRLCTYFLEIYGDYMGQTVLAILASTS